MALLPLYWSRPTEPGFIRAAHYFGSGWPVNCWSAMSVKDAKRDFARMRRDGFNTVILLIPWRGFQADPYRDLLREEYLSLLRQLMRVAQRQGLWVILRLSYAHHICDESDYSSEEFTTALLGDDAVRRLWQRYLLRIHNLLREFPNYRQSFISWEEFWGVIMRHMREDAGARAAFAGSVGYDKWLARQGLTQVAVTVPLADSPDFVHYHRFANGLLRQLYELGAEVIPDLGFEVRVDDNAWYDVHGQMHWLSNDHYRDITPLRYSYWAPFIGALNQGEILSASQGAALLERALLLLTDDGRTIEHVLDQFNFIDDTFKYADVHARISPQEMQDFLQLACLLLQRYSRGYGIWAWRDYVQNSLINPRFLQGLAGWRTLAGRPQARRRRRTFLRLRAGDAVAQHFRAASHGLHRRYRGDVLHVRVQLAMGWFDRRPDPANLEATLDGDHWFSLQASADPDVLAVDLPTDNPLYGKRGARFELRCVAGRVHILEVLLYQHIYRVGFRKHDGKPGAHLDYMLYLNAATKQVQGESAAQP